MFRISVLIGLFVMSSVNGDACTDCKTAFEGSKTCATFKTYIACLETNLDTCVLSVTDAPTVATEYAALTSCTLTDVCTCQKDFFAKDISGATGCNAIKTRIGCLKGKTTVACDGSTTPDVLAAATDTKMGSLTPSCTIAANTVCKCEQTYALAAGLSTPATKCTKTKEYVACLKGKTGAGCDGITMVPALATAAGTTLTGIGNTDCPMTDACPCDLAYTSSDISTTKAKCTALKNEISCLVGKSGTGCDETTPVHTLATTASQAITADTTCTVEENCQCEIDYAKTQITSCSSIKTLTTCIMYDDDNGCGASRLRSDIGTFIQTTVTTLGTSTCPITSTCQCQIDFAKASVTSANKCTAAGTFVTCISGITTTTELACDGVTTQAFVKTNSTGIHAEFCTGSSVKAAYLVLLMPITLFFL